MRGCSHLCCSRANPKREERESVSNPYRKIKCGNQKNERVQSPREQRERGYRTTRTKQSTRVRVRVSRYIRVEERREG